MLDRPKYPDVDGLKHLCRSVYLSSRITHGSLYVWGLKHFPHSSLNQLHNNVLSKTLLVASFFNWWYYYILKFLLETSYMICAISGIYVCKSQGPSVDSYWKIRIRNNYTCIELYTPFNFAVVSLSDYVLFKTYNCVTYLSYIPKSLLWPVDSFNPFNRT